MPRQDSTTDQLESVACLLVKAGHSTAAAWVRAWDDYKLPITPADLELVNQMAVIHGCYDAHDAVLMRTGKHNLQRCSR